MLLRSQCAVHYTSPEVLAAYFDTITYPKPGFMKAMSNSSTELSQATLKSTELPPKISRKLPLQDEEGCATDKEEELAMSVIAAIKSVN